MPMPYTIEYFEGNRRETTPPRPADLPKGEEWPRTFECDRLPFKVYPSGPKVRATAEEVHVWEIVQFQEKMLMDGVEYTKGLKKELATREATIQMACDRLGGQVEGAPPHEGNFLQRIDDLVELEKKGPVQAPGPQPANKAGRR
jgi:hypothetical protein